jgi:hypothetical protein
MQANISGLLHAERDGELREPCELKGVQAPVCYIEPGRERTFNYMYQPSDGAPLHNCRYVPRSVWISDARAADVSPIVSREGYELRNAPTSVHDFEDEGTVRGRYYPEVIELAKHSTGASEAYVFDHQVRRRETGRPPLTLGRQGDGKNPGAAGRIHNDYTESSGPARLAIVAAQQGIALPVERFAIVNVWRSIGGKIVDTPLALCDARTVADRDLVVGDLLYPGRKGELYLLQHAPRHRWAYFPLMDNDEVLVFKQYDSQRSGVARFTPHVAFDLPKIPLDAPLRQSIEVRCLVVFR